MFANEQNNRNSYRTKLKILEEKADAILFWLEFIADREIIHKKQLKGLI